MLNLITTLQSGFPITPQIGSNVSGDGDTRNPDRPSLNPDFVGPIVIRQGTQWFAPAPNPATATSCTSPGSTFPFALPCAGTFGNVGRGSFSGPGLANVDVSLFKDTQITERVKMEFRTECFNVLNHPNFGTPNLIAFSGGAPNPTFGQITTTVTASRPDVAVPPEFAAVSV